MLICPLGTSSGVPTRQRNVAGCAVALGSGKNAWCLVDCGEGTQHRIQRSAFSAYRLAAIFITHHHGDHCYGLPGLVASLAMAGRTEPLIIVAPASVLQWLQLTLQMTDVQLSFSLQYLDWAEQQTVTVAGFAVDWLPLSHRVPSVAFRFTECDVPVQLRVDKLQQAGVASGPHWQQLQRGEDAEFQGRMLMAAEFTHAKWPARTVIIAGDNAEPALLQQACQQAQLLVHEATYTLETAAKVGPGPMHSTAHAVASMAQLAKLPNLVLTHFSPRYTGVITQPYSAKNTLPALWQEAKTVYQGQLWLANDLDVFTLDGNGQVSVAPYAKASAHR